MRLRPFLAIEYRPSTRSYGMGVLERLVRIVPLVEAPRLVLGLQWHSVTRADSRWNRDRRLCRGDQSRLGKVRVRRVGLVRQVARQSRTIGYQEP